MCVCVCRCVTVATDLCGINYVQIRTLMRLDETAPSHTPGDAVSYPPWHNIAYRYSIHLNTHLLI